jgi:GAF domain-containing protein
VERRLDALYEAAGGRPDAAAESETVVVPMPDDAEPGTGDATELLGHAIDSGVQLSRLYAEGNVARRRLELSLKTAHALNRLSRRLLGAETPGIVWKEFHRTCVDEVPAAASSLLICPGRGLAPRAVELQGLDEDPLLEAFGDRLVTFMEEQNGPALISEADDQELFSTIRESASGIRALAVAPVFARGSFRGALALYRSGGHPPFHLSDQRFLSAAADLVSLGLTRALHERELAASVDADPTGATAADAAREIGRPLATLQSSLDALGGIVEEIGRAHRRMAKATDRGELSAVRMAIDDPDLREATESLGDIVQDAGEQASRIALKLRMLLRAAPRPSRPAPVSREADPARDQA